MATANLTDRDVQDRRLVMQQLEWDPSVDAGDIGVTAKHGSVTLSGFANTYADKLAAERAAKRVYGVRAVANDIEVRLKLGRTDADIAADAALALKIHAAIPEAVQAAVHHSQVTLTGTVSWLFQKQQAERVIAHIRGVRHVVNHIVVGPRAAERDVQKRIVQALHRNADIEAAHITVHVDGGVARLAGTSRTLAQRDAAERAAAEAPGVTMIDNQLVVEPTSRTFDEGPDEIC